MPETAHPGFVTVDPGDVSGGHGAKPLAVAALSTTAPAATSGQMFASTGTGSMHRNSPLTFGVAGEHSFDGDLPLPLALPDAQGADAEGSEPPDSGPIEDAVAPAAPAPSAGSAAVSRLAGPVDQVVSEAPTLVGGLISAAPDVTEPDTAPDGTALKKEERGPTRR
ncbi:MAG: hypothetical protein ACRDTG_21675 [Pseudonocardiaceae bacterium]